MPCAAVSCGQRRGGTNYPGGLGMMKRSHPASRAWCNSQKCAAFGWAPLHESSRTPRRLFLGALIANEPPIVLQALSAEIDHVVSFVSFVESALTQTGTPRVLQYGSAAHHGRGSKFKWLAKLFVRKGVAINVTVAMNVKSLPVSQRRPLVLEWLWRKSIVEAWITHGMRPGNKLSRRRSRS